MKQNKAKLYAKALAEIILQKHTPAEEKKIVDNFLKLLEKSGMEKKAKEIIVLAEDFILRKQGNSKITFETARKASVSQKKLLQSIAKEGDIVNERISPELIAGVRIIINNEKQFDGSLQRKIQRIFS